MIYIEQDVYKWNGKGKEMTFLVRAWINVDYLEQRYRDEDAAFDGLYYAPVFPAFHSKVYPWE